MTKKNLQRKFVAKAKGCGEMKVYILEKSVGDYSDEIKMNVKAYLVEEEAIEKLEQINSVIEKFNPYYNTNCIHNACMYELYAHGVIEEYNHCMYDVPFFTLSEVDLI